MKKSSNTTGIRAPKSDSQLPEKIHKTQSARAAKLKAKKEVISATKIQKAWFIYVDKTLFKLLKHTVCAAEYCVAHELLKEVSPREAELLKDPSMKCKVRFRFSGETFPPCIVFKVFLKNGHGYKYFSGKDLLKPSSKHSESLATSPSSENLPTDRRKKSQTNTRGRLTDSKKMVPQVDCDTQTLSNKAIKVENLQNQRYPRQQRVSPPQENPRMKCRNCGAFGHTVRSKKCPIKSWDGAMVPLPLGVKKEKENQDPRKPGNLLSLKPADETEEEKKERERLEQQRKALLLKFPKKPPGRKPRSWKDTTHSGDYLRRPSRPSFIHISKKAPLNHAPTSLLSLKRSDGEAPSTEDPAFGHSDENLTFGENPEDQKSTQYYVQQVPQAAFTVQEMGQKGNTQSPAQHSDKDKHSGLCPVARTGSWRAELNFKVTQVRNLQLHLPANIIENPPKKRRISSYQRPQKNTEKSMLKPFHVVPHSSTSQVEPVELPQVISVEQQPPQSRALLNFSQPFAESCHPFASHVPVQPLRMVFTRLRNDCWSSKILENSSSHPPEKKRSSGKSSPSLEWSEEPLEPTEYLHNHPFKLLF